jgi:hypothetical protein
MPGAPDEQADPLVTAYEQLTIQVNEARGALAEAVSALRLENDLRREEVTKLTEQNTALRVDNDALRVDNDALRRDTEHVHAEAERRLKELGEQLQSYRNMKSVRLVTFPRRVLRRLRKPPQ